MAIYVGKSRISKVAVGRKQLSKLYVNRKNLVQAAFADGSSAANAAASGKVLYENGITTTGNYWLNGGSGAYEAYVKMDAGGGWINVNLSNSVYPDLLTSGWGGGGSDLIAGGGTGTALLNANNSTHAQANSYGCASSNYKSYIDLDSTFASDFGITEVRIKILYVSDNNYVICGPYWPTTTSSRTILQGTATEVAGTCNNPPNDYSTLVGTGFTVEWHGPLNTVTRLLETWTACGGSFTMQLLEVYVR